MNESMDDAENALSNEEVEALVQGYFDAPAEELPTQVTSEASRLLSDSRVQLSRGTVCSSNNQYVIKEQIGRGGMGTVFRAFDTKLQRDVALKVLDCSDDDLLGRFLKEQEITACLDHPNFVRILATGYIATGDGSLPFYTMPLIRGQNLERLILRLGLPGEEGDQLRRDFRSEMLLHLFGQLCLTIQSAHDARIIHRDLKPSNILVGPYGEAYVTDLGLAKFLGISPNETGRFERRLLEQFARLSQLSSTTTPGQLGTPYYMAPEQLLAPWTVDHRADIFGLGGILYFIITGQRTAFVPPAMDPLSREERKSNLLFRLRPFGVSLAEISDLLKKPRSALPPELYALTQEYLDLVGMEKNSQFHRFRMTMRNCEIIPPGEILARYRATLTEHEVPGIPRPEVSPELERICLNALAKDPEDRFPSCQALWQALVPHWAGGLQSAAGEPEAQTHLKLWI